MNFNPEKFPVLCAGEISKNSFAVQPKLARNMEWIRATSLNVLRECPEQFYAKFCQGIPQPVQKGPNYGLIGTVFHEVIENYIIDKWDIHDPIASDIQKLLVTMDIRKSEILALGQYLERIKQYRTMTYKVEYEFEYELVPGYPKIRGHIDWIQVLRPHIARITDHKTNRQPKPLEKWIDDLQTMTYSWATRKLLGIDYKIFFNIGYINLPYDANWECLPEFDETLKIWYKDAWDRLLEMEEKNKFERTACETCKYCPRTGDCASERKGKKVNKKLLDITMKRIPS